MNEEKIKYFGAGIQRLINKQNLSQNDTYTMFAEILLNQQPDLQQGAFLAALVSKGETIDEIIGAWLAICDYDTIPAQLDPSLELTENSGTGMDSLKTFNVSSAAAIVAAACGVNMARHGARALTSTCGTVDIMEAVGVDVNCNVHTVVKSITSAGIGLFNGMSPKVHPGGLGRILSQIRFGSTLNIAASLANPAKPTYGLRGVYAPTLILPVSKIMTSIGYKRGMVVYGTADNLQGGMDELSVCGETLIQEFGKNAIKESYTLRPEAVGLQSHPFIEIATTGNLKTETERFLSVLSGVGPAACTDFTCLNAGAILYASEKTNSLKEGVILAQEAISTGAAINKLRQWVAVQNENPIEALEQLELKIKSCKKLIQA